MSPNEITKILIYFYIATAGKTKADFNDTFVFLKDLKITENNKFNHTRSVSRNEFTYVVALIGADKYLHCTGSILTNMHVLTAAQCNRALYVFEDIGYFKHNYDLKIKIVHFIIHQDYAFDYKLINEVPSVFKLENDIAIAITDRNMIVDALIKPVAHLSTTLKNVAEFTTMVSYTRSNEDTLVSKDILVSTDIRLKSCDTFDKNVICGMATVDLNLTNDCNFTNFDGSDEGGKCIGDSGAPLMSNGSLVAIASLGLISCEFDSSKSDGVVVFTLVKPYMSWIEGVLESRRSEIRDEDIVYYDTVEQSTDSTISLTGAVFVREVFLCCLAVAVFGVNS